MHGDLKTSNIYFAEEGVPRVGDFGLTCEHEENELFGTPYYISPE